MGREALGHLALARGIVGPAVQTLPQPAVTPIKTTHALLSSPMALAVLSSLFFHPPSHSSFFPLCTYVSLPSSSSSLARSYFLFYSGRNLATGSEVADTTRMVFHCRISPLHFFFFKLHTRAVLGRVFVLLASPIRHYKETDSTSRASAQWCT